MRKVGIFVVAALCSAVFASCVFALSTFASVRWSQETIVKESEISRSLPTNTWSTCSGAVQHIAIEGWAMLKEACVFGGAGGTQVARYAGSSGVYLYAISFPVDAKFTPVEGLCLYRERCVYGQEADTMIIEVQIVNGLAAASISNFSKRLVKHTSPTVHYQVTYPSPLPYISIGDEKALAHAKAVSQNGRWALVELERFGFVRINLHTLQYKRVVAPGALYGYGSNPSYEMTISNDGTKIAIAGRGSNIAVYEIDNECGDVLTNASATTFSPYIYACPAAAVDVYGLFPGFNIAHMPRFSPDGNRLHVYVTAGQNKTYTTLAPQSLVRDTNTLQYIAFGDSFSSGEGELSDAFYISSTNTHSNKCHVSTRSYPYLVGAFWGVEAHNFSCSGSRSDDVRRASIQYANEATGQPSHISIGVGGNDIDLVGKLKTCLSIGTCEWARNERRAVTAEEIRSLFTRGVELIQEFKHTYPRAGLAIVGYPSVVNTGGAAQCGAVVSTLLNAAERQYLDESVRYLNKVLRAVAQYSKITYVDIEDSHVGERLCDPIEAAMNSIRFGNDIAPIPLLENIKVIGAESFHPTPRGHQLAALNIQSQFAQPWPSAGCDTCQHDEGLLEPSSYWREGEEGAGSGGGTFVQRAIKFLQRTEVTYGDTIRASFLPNTFKPHSTVRFELHSSPVELAEYEVAEDGSLDVEVTFPADIQGTYHTVHALGTSFSENEIDAYQTITVADPTVSNEDIPNTTTVPPAGNNSGASNSGKQATTKQQPQPQNSRVAYVPRIQALAAVPKITATNSPENLSGTPEVAGALKEPDQKNLSEAVAAQSNIDLRIIILIATPIIIAVCIIGYCMLGRQV